MSSVAAMVPLLLLLLLLPPPPLLLLLVVVLWCASCSAAPTALCRSTISSHGELHAPACVLTSHSLSTWWITRWIS
jgi:hypothetical protein